MKLVKTKYESKYRASVSEWNVAEPDDATVAKLVKDARSNHGTILRKPIAETLVNRGFSSYAEVENFCEPSLRKLHSPLKLPDCRAALDRIKKAIEQGEIIFVWGDYDVDGITSTAIAVLGLQRVGGDVRYYTPHRTKDGYDIQKHSVDKALDAGATLLISVDCGIRAIEVAEYAAEKGIDLIITDHHHLRQDGRIPSCLAVVNPQRPDSIYPFSGLAGCGIIFKLMSQLWHEMGVGGKTALNELIEFVALGTVADIAPMCDENRVMVHMGCQALSGSSRPGIQSLMRVAGVQSVTAPDIGFRLGPRLNAKGRLGASEDALELLLCQNTARAHALAQEMDRTNDSRQAMQETYLQQAMKMVDEKHLDDHVIVLSSPEWHVGIVGLIASGVSGHYCRPSMIAQRLEGDICKGSCRTYRDFNILEAMESESVRPLFKKYGGHKNAAGFTVELSQFSTLRQNINDYAAGLEGIEDAGTKRVDVDAVILYPDISLSTYRQIASLTPFGQGWTEPIFVTYDLVVKESRKLGGEKHAKFQLVDVDDQSGRSVDAVAWKQGDLIEAYPPGTGVDVVYALEADNFTGKERAMMRIIDMRKS